MNPNFLIYFKNKKVKKSNKFWFLCYSLLFFSVLWRKYAEPPHKTIAPNKNIIMAPVFILLPPYSSSFFTNSSHSSISLPLSIHGIIGIINETTRPNTGIPRLNNKNIGA